MTPTKPLVDVPQEAVEDLRRPLTQRRWRDPIAGGRLEGWYEQRRVAPHGRVLANRLRLAGPPG